MHFHSSVVRMGAVFLQPGSATLRMTVVMVRMKETSVQRKHALISRYRIQYNIMGNLRFKLSDCGFLGYDTM